MNSNEEKENFFHVHVIEVGGKKSNLHELEKLKNDDEKSELLIAKNGRKRTHL